ncbi:MAG: GNAT family N-acetyltransferase [Bacteroidales bacterium]|nr:GNAT family N-acetyltransferase [Bacteroidales bacterium]
MDHYIIRRSTKQDDDKNLNKLFTPVFCPEEVGQLAEVLYNHFPGQEKRYWFIAEEKSTSQVVSAFALIPWQWRIKGIQFKVAEMGLVGTNEAHRGKGLMNLLNREFDQTLHEEQFDLAVIQGIPGFYHKFGYHYAVTLDNHINLPLSLIPDDHGREGYRFRFAEDKDIAFLVEEDKRYGDSFFITSARDEQHFRYLLHEGKQTDTVSDFIIMEDTTSGKKYSFRINHKGFGTGLILSEASAGMDYGSICSMLHFCRKTAIDRKKPYIRINLHHHSEVAKAALYLGAKKSYTYAWQIKIPDEIKLMKKLAPVLEGRIGQSIFKGFTGKYRLNLFTKCIDMIWHEGILIDVQPGTVTECEHTLNIGRDMLPALLLGYRSWGELQYIRPDVAPEVMYLFPDAGSLSDITGLLTDVLFPAEDSWVYCQY